jgi:hypothetical protein
MALIREFICSLCQETRIEVLDFSGVCQECRAEKANKTRRVYLSGLKGLTVEERLASIESKLYDLNIGQRLERIESRYLNY